jgi:hypothetical protein
MYDALDSNKRLKASYFNKFDNVNLIVYVSVNNQSPFISHI